MLRPLQGQEGCHGPQARKEPPAEGEGGDGRYAAEHARARCVGPHPRMGPAAGRTSGTPGRHLRALSWVAGCGWGSHARGATTADPSRVLMGVGVTARASHHDAGSRAARLRRVTTGRVGTTHPWPSVMSAGQDNPLLVGSWVHRRAAATAQRAKGRPSRPGLGSFLDVILCHAIRQATRRT